MKTSEANIEDLKGMVVSDGTMRSEDLIPKFLNVLKVYGKDVYDKYVGENPEVLDLSGMDDETMGWVVDELFDKLNEIAPEGYSFESQDGDGACYGFWSVDADERKKCEDVPEIKVGDFVEYDKNGREDWNWAEVTGVNEDGTLNLHITDMDKTNYDDVDNVPVASCHKLPRFAGMTDTGHYYMDGPINLYKGGWEICVTKKDLDPSKYEFIGTIDSYEDMVQVDAYYDDNYVYDEDDESEVREYFGVDFPEGAVTFADFKEDVVGESCVKGMVSEGWSGGFFSREDVLNAMDGGILNKDWKLEKRFGSWGCYVNQKTGRPLVMQVMVSQDRTGDWGYKPVTSDMGPVDTNIQAAKWLKPRLEQWASEDTKNAESIPDYEWHWIDKCLGKETANKDRKNLVKSLVKGDKIKLIDTVANGAVVTFIDMITPSKMRIDYNGREMSCKTSFIDHKVEGAAESKKCEAYIQPVTLYSTTRYDDAEAVQSFLRDIGGDSVTVDKQRNGDVLSVNVSGSDDDVEAFVDTYKNEYGSIVKDCEVDATGWTAPEDIYYIATEQGRKELRGEYKKGESAGETMRVDVYADRRNFDPEEFVKYVRKAGGKNGGYISVDSVVSVDVLNKANRLAQAHDYKRTESKKSEDHRRKDRYGHSVRRFTAKDLSVTPDIKITKIVPPTEEDVRKCAVTKNGKFVVFFDVDSETFKLEYNPHLEGYDGMRSVARENCSIQNLATGQTWDCTGVYTLPEWITYGGYSDYTTDHLDDPAVQAFMNPSEQMVLTQFIKPFAKDYLGVDATESKKQESEDDKLVWGVTVEYTPVNGETRRTDVAPSCYTEERAKEAAIARVTKDYGPLKDVKVIRVDKLPEWAARNIRDLVRNNKTESMSNRIENTTITEQEFSDILNAYVKEVEGNDIKPIRIEVLKTEPVEGDGTLIKLHYDARENGWSNARTYALVFGDLHKNRDNDLIYVLHDWQSGEKVTPEDIADHDWELVNNHIRPSEILDATKSAESLDPSIDVKGRGVVELIEDDYLKLSRDINSRGYCKDKDGAYNVWIGGSFKGMFPSVEAAADAGYTLVEGKRCEALVSEKTFKQGVDEFIGAAPEGGWSDYWAMQQDWEFYKDSLCRDGVITQKQADSWSNPCTPETFDRWQKRNGLVRRGYESKKSEVEGKRCEETFDPSQYEYFKVWYIIDGEPYFVNKTELADACDVINKVKQDGATTVELYGVNDTTETLISLDAVGCGTSESKKNEDMLYMGCHGYYTKNGRTYIIEDESPEWNGEIVGKWSISDWRNVDSEKVIREWRKDHPTKSFGGGNSVESKKSEARPTKQEAQIKELCKLCRNDKNVAEAVFKALTKDYNTSLDPVLAGQYLTAKWKSKLEELGGCNGWYDGFKKLYAAMGSDFVCSVLQDLKLGSSEIGCGACITIVDAIYDKVVKRNEAKKSASHKTKEELSIDDYVKYDMDHYAALAAGWTWDDEQECYMDKDGNEVDWDSSDAVMIDPIEFGGHTYKQVNVWGDGTVEFQDESGESLNWADFDDELVSKVYAAIGGVVNESKKSEDFDMNQAFFQAKKAITDWTKRQGHKTLEWLYTDGRKSPTSYPSGIWDFEWDTGNGMATAELKVSPYETRTNSWNDRMDFGLRVGTEDKPTFYTSVEDVLYALDTLISKTEIKMESKKSESSRDITPENIEALLDEKGLVFEKEGTPTSPTYTVYDSIKTKELAEWTHHKVGNMFYIAMTSWGGASISVLCLGGDYYSNKFVKRGIATMGTLRKYVDLIMSWFKSPNNDERVSESLTLKQKELKDMARFGQAEDITTISDAEAKELKKKGIETVGISRGTYGMNGALLRDSEGKKYVITARSSNLFYFV